MDTVDRIFELVDEVFPEQKDFAAALGIPPQRVSEWRKRKLASYQRCLSQIAEVLGTTTEYLLTGEGPKKKAVAHVGTTAITDDDIKAAFFNGADPDMTPEEMDAMWEDARAYIAFKMQQRRQKQ
ncbi:MAG: helix-turn-helix domain-containing protein [Oscillibacter sp.]|nr:helix-turn-helix domain-containing protein [Oscillibacter sp.]